MIFAEYIFAACMILAFLLLAFGIAFVIAEGFCFCVRLFRPDFLRRTWDADQIIDADRQRKETHLVALDYLMRGRIEEQRKLREENRRLQEQKRKELEAVYAKVAQSKSSEQIEEIQFDLTEELQARTSATVLENVIRAVQGAPDFLNDKRLYWLARDGKFLASLVRPKPGVREARAAFAAINPKDRLKFSAREVNIWAQTLNAIPVAANALARVHDRSQQHVVVQ